MPSLPHDFMRAFRAPLLRNSLLPLLLIALLLALLAFRFYPVFHLVAELFGVIVAVLMFVVMWHTYAFSHNSFLLFLACGDFWVGGLGLLHTLSYKGMGLLPVEEADIATQFWIAARWAESLLLFSAPWFFQRRIRVETWFTGFGLIAFGLTLWIFSGHFPAAYLEGSGLTPFKIVSEYLIILVLIAAGVRLWRNRVFLDREILVLVLISIGFTILAELAFTVYIGVYSLPNLLGHLFMLISLWLLFNAMIHTSLSRPFVLLSHHAETYESIPMPAVVMDAAGKIGQVNRAACNEAGLNEAEILGRDCHELFHSPSTPRGECLLCAKTAAGEGLVREQVFLSAEQGWRQFTLTPMRLDLSGGRCGLAGMVQVSEDISALKDTEQRLREARNELRYLADHDSLTGLPNRRLFNDRLEHAVARADREQQRLAVMFLDLDRFKNINDSLGHHTGDTLLKLVAQRLLSLLRKDDTIARLGGDEFVILAESLESPAAVVTLADKIITAVRTPFEIGEHTLYLSTSLGICFYPNDAHNAESILKNADAAMYRAKEKGRDNFQFCSTELTTTAFERLFMENSLRQAIQENQLKLYFQPQYNTPEQRIIGAEVLVRWQHPEMGLVAPDRFIGLAEESGLITAIGEWVLRGACLQMRAWQEEGYPIESLAVNVSGKQVDPLHRLDRSVAEILQETGLDPGYLELEITESVIMRETEYAMRTLDALKAVGVRLSIDDFGTGFSSLSYLKRLPIHKLKIDKSFVRGLPEDKDDIAIVRAVIALSWSMGLAVIAEGVETQEQNDFLIDEGCYEAQGFLYSKPLPLEAFTALLEKERRRQGVALEINGDLSFKPGP